MAMEADLYQAFGFRIRSELPLPELDVAVTGTGHQVDIRTGVLPDPTGMTWIVPGVAADTGRFWMEVPGVVRILVRAGREMIVDMVAGGDEAEMRLFLLGSAMGALLHQRGLLPLHASVVAVDGRAVAFTGPSGAGKSTIALHLADWGYPVVSDDICVIEITPGGGALVHPGPPRMKLWQRSLAATGRSADGLAGIPGVRGKYLLSLAPATENGPLPLRAVVLLDQGETGAVDRIAGSAAVAALLSNTFRGELVAPMGRGQAHFDQCVAVARDPGVYSLARTWSLDRLVESHAVLRRWLSAGPGTRAA